MRHAGLRDALWELKGNQKDPSTHKSTECSTASTTKRFRSRSFSSGHAAPRARSPRSGPSSIPTEPSAYMLPAFAPPRSHAPRTRRTMLLTQQQNSLCYTSLIIVEGLVILLDLHTKSHRSRVEERKVSHYSGWC